MRLFILTLFIVVGVYKVQAQRENLRSDTLIHYVGKLNLSISHNDHDLSKLDKTTLARVHARRVKIFLELLPYMAIQAKPAQDVRHINIPMTKKRLKEAKKQQELRQKYVSHLYESMKRIDVYADKQDLIDQITLVDLLIVHLIDFINNDNPGQYNN